MDCLLPPSGKRAYHHSWRESCESMSFRPTRISREHAFETYGLEFCPDRVSGTPQVR